MNSGSKRRSEGINRRKSDLAEARRFLLRKLHLHGPLLSRDKMVAAASDLGMIQIDSIRVNGLRNHELAWAARGSAPIGDYYDMLYKKRHFIETHYPLFAIRRDWVKGFQQDFSKTISNRDRLSELRPTMRRVKRHIKENGPTSSADFQSERLKGGFNTIKATTLALEYLCYLGEIQICGRTSHFHRLFDLTERIAPELISPTRLGRKELEDFCVRTAASVLKLASREQLARRVAHHLGAWRQGGLAIARKAVERALDQGTIDACDFAYDNTGHPFLILAEDKVSLPRSSSSRNGENIVRVIPPLDNLLFSRDRLRELFDLDFKFEAYTPRHSRRFYFALPVLYQDRIVGLIDAKKAGKEWRIMDLELAGTSFRDECRAAIHRLADLANTDRIVCADNVPSAWRRTLNGTLER